MTVNEKVSGIGANSERTDLNVSNQPIRYISGLGYGEGGAVAKQGGAPMAGSVPMPDVIPLSEPTRRPNEPASYGLDIGPGPGSEIVNLPNTEPTASTVLRKIAQFDNSGEAELAISYLSDYGF